MLIPYSEFLRTTGLGEEQGKRAWKLISSQTYPWEQHVQRASDMEPEQWLTTGDSHIDQLLGGGIRMGSIVEIVGESAAGKTQFCLQLAIAAQLPRSIGGIGGDVVYVSTEGAVPTSRLATMVDPFISRVYNGNISADRIMQHIQVAELEDMESMFHALNYKIPALLATGKVRLVIIDSIAAHLRFDLGGNESLGKSQDFYKERSSLLVQLGAKFKKWADQYHCTFVCVNQVKDVFGQPQKQAHLLQKDAASGSEQSTQTSVMDLENEFTTMVRSNKAPALGAIWANIINVRIMLYQRRGLTQSQIARNPDASEEAMPPEHLLRTRRWIENTFSPWAPQAQCEVMLDNGGFQHISL
ncbi:DNA repair protein rhp57 [Coemansia brasiliensis]|uniref:DNA repair protein rhp57 n=1 Tax=Coemansia brasiliensis TaxID=2650707 RepID=A0A9W8IAA3_9FUNG|nr:DNA repair protein rhp57 [Coemansia brasiliensis]